MDETEREALRSKLYDGLTEDCASNEYNECQTHPDERNYNPGGNDHLQCALCHDTVDKLLDLVQDAITDIRAEHQEPQQ